MKRRIVCLWIMVFLLNIYVPVFAQVEGAAADYFVGDTIAESQYKLGPGDMVEANLLVGANDLALKYDFNIGPDGKIFFPKVGEISLLGLTIPEAKTLIDNKVRTVYQEKYVFSFRLIGPRQIRIYLSGSEDKALYVGDKKFVSIYGEVAKSGRFEFLPGKKFSDYISYAGGPTLRANLSSCTITRKDNKIGVDGADIIFNGEADKDMEIMPGDVINIPAQFFYFSDFASFTSLIFTTIALYNTVFPK